MHHKLKRGVESVKGPGFSGFSKAQRYRCVRGKGIDEGVLTLDLRVIRKEGFCKNTVTLELGSVGG